MNKKEIVSFIGGVCVFAPPLSFIATLYIFVDDYGFYAFLFGFAVMLIFIGIACTCIKIEETITADEKKLKNKTNQKINSMLYAKNFIKIKENMMS